MATDTQRLIVSLEATTKKFEAALNRANGVANKRARSIETRFAKTNSVVSASFARLGAVFASGLALRGAQQLVDAATRIQNSLKVVGLAGDELAAVYDRLFASAQRNAAPIESLVELYSRAALVQKELGVSTEELLGFTDNVAVALRVSGKSAEETSGALLQLSQALGSGVVRAEEFNSILENALPIAQAAAAGLEEAGGSVAKLRQLVIDGKISSEVFFRAFEAGSATLKQKVKSSQFTISQSFQTLQNSLIDLAGEFDQSTGASSRLAAGIVKLAEVIDGFNVSGYIEELKKAKKETDSFLAGLGNAEIFKYFNEYFGYTENGVGKSAPPGLRPTGVGKGSAGNSGGTGGTSNAGIDPLGIGLAIKPISLSDYKPPATGKGTNSGSSLDEYQRATQALVERTAAIEAETNAQAGLNPLVDDYGAAVLKAKTALELEQAARQAGIEITPEVSASINEMADKYVAASVAAEKLAESQDKVRNTAQELSGIAKDVLGGFISDLRNGTDAAEALQNALNKVLDKLIDIALQAAVSGLTNGILGAIGGGGSSDPWAGLRTYAVGGISRKPAIFGESGPEAAVPLPDGRRIPVDLRIPSSAGMGGMRGGRMQIALEPGLTATLIDTSVKESVDIVSAQTPGVIAASAGRAASDFGKGHYDPMMRRRYNTSPQKIRRG